MASASREDAADRDSAYRAKRAKIIAVACNSCRHRKVRCDGGRPTCKRCEGQVAVCVYEAHEHETRTHALKRENSMLRQQLAECRQQLQGDGESPHRESSRRQRDALNTASSQSGQSRSTVTSQKSTSSAREPYMQMDEWGLQSRTAGSRSSRAPSQASSGYTTCMTLINALISRSDNEAAMILAKLRTNVPWAQIVDELTDISGSVAAFVTSSLLPPDKSNPHPEPTTARRSQDQSEDDFVFEE